MRIAYFDTVAGISGDMTLGAMIHAGVPAEHLRQEIGKLGLDGVEIEASHIQRNGITAIKLDVIIPGGEHSHRHLETILRMIRGSSLSDGVKENAEAIFREVARAEAAVHGIPVEKVHFHEVGALDSIVDIVGTAVCLEKAGIEKVYTSPVRLGSGGFVQTSHGSLPLPAPAAVEILKGYPVVLTDVPFELTTPTGAAIVKALSSGVFSSEEIQIEKVGYGAGTRDLPGMPNLLRVMIGEMPVEAAGNKVVVIEANIDDMNPEIYPYVIERLLAEGALDAYCIPVVMKKGRPGVLLAALAERSLLGRVTGVFLSETTTIGVRYHMADRTVLGREQREVRTEFGMVRMKVIRTVDGERMVPEYEECRRIAAEAGIPLVEVYRRLGKKG